MPKKSSYTDFLIGPARLDAIMATLSALCQARSSLIPGNQPHTATLFGCSPLLGNGMEWDQVPVAAFSSVVLREDPGPQEGCKLAELKVSWCCTKSVYPNTLQLLMVNLSQDTEINSLWFFKCSLIKVNGEVNSAFFFQAAHISKFLIIPRNKACDHLGGAEDLLLTVSSKHQLAHLSDGKVKATGMHMRGPQPHSHSTTPPRVSAGSSWFRAVHGKLQVKQYTLRNVLIWMEKSSVT